ncbi:MAG: hypothetical protein HY236_16365 [Acidobacteria bacterium]|nr:hypothetical protein [Acidobacteriota bacterium]
MPQPGPGGRKLPLWPTLVIVILLGGGFLIVRQARINSERAVRLNQLAKESSDLRARLEQVSQENELLRQSRLAGARPGPAREEAASRRPPQGERLSAEAEESETLGKLRENLAAAQASISNFEARIAELEAERQKTAEENKRLAVSQTELADQLAGARRTIETMEKESMAKDERLFQVEFSRKKQQQETATGEQKAAQMAKLAAELQEIHRRREVYLRSILSRYREVTEQYRSLSAVLETRATHEGGPTPGTGQLSRIQNAIALAEEDLRQLESLNAQAQLVQRKLAGK